MNSNTLYRLWLEKAEDAELRAELLSIQGDREQIGDRFSAEPAFGTGGLRAQIGAGGNRMNVYTVARASQGYADFLKAREKSPSVAIAYDSRNKSELFAKTAAGVFASNGVKVHIYPNLMPTPALSFAVRQLRLSGGIVITASHNGAEYNGYKVYDRHGCQIMTKAAQAISEHIAKIDIFEGVNAVPFEYGVSEGMIEYIEPSMKDEYIQAVSSKSLLGAKVDRLAPIAYTPLNGSGIQCVPECLERNGFVNITIPDVQKEPDGDFPTCRIPNPEMREALNVGIAWAKKHGCELLIATDPDCDRVGAAVLGGNGYTVLTGNQVGVLLLDFICLNLVGTNRMPHYPIVIKSIVTTPMANAVARHYGAKIIDVLTGFKYIGEQLNLLEESGEAERFIFGFEESCGYLSGSHVRDKDGVNAALLICEMFAAYRAEGITLLQALDKLYQKHGFYADSLVSCEFNGEKGSRRIQEIMKTLRMNHPWEIQGLEVDSFCDYELSEMIFFDGRAESIFLPKANVLQLRMKNGSSVIVRPSGTEPKIKLYFSARSESVEKGEGIIRKLERYMRYLSRE